MLSERRERIVYSEGVGSVSGHGIAHTIGLVPVVGDWRSRHIGVFTGSVINLTITALFVRCMRPTRVADALVVGIF